MRVFEVLILEDKYDEKDNLQINVLFEKQLIFAYSKKDAVKKAVIQSGISSEKIGEVEIFVREFPHESD